MHMISRVRPSEDTWERVALLCLQQLTEDAQMNHKRVRALEHCILDLTELLAESSGLDRRDLSDVTESFRTLTDETSAWSKHSLDQAEELALAVRHLLAQQQSERAIVPHEEETRLAS